MTFNKEAIFLSYSRFQNGFGHPAFTNLGDSMSHSYSHTVIKRPPLHKGNDGISIYTIFQKANYYIDWAEVSNSLLKSTVYPVRAYALIAPFRKSMEYIFRVGRFRIFRRKGYKAVSHYDLRLETVWE
jgi:hypothetical protein